MKSLYKIWMLVLSAGVLVGLYAIVKILTLGHGEQANATQLIPWGLQVSVYIFLALASSGCSFIAYLGTLGNIESLKKIAPRATLLGLLTVVAGFTSLSLEIGRIERLPLEFALNPNFMSLMWWMGVFYTLKIFTLIGEVILIKFHNERIDVALNKFGLVVGIAAVSCLGTLFGVLEGRSFVFGAFTPVYFLIMTFAGGAALLLFVTSVLGLLDENSDMKASIDMLRKIFIASMTAVMLISIFRQTVGVWISNPNYDLFEYGTSRFWRLTIFAGMVIPLLLVLASKAQSILAVSALISLVVQLIDRNALIVGAQQIPQLQGVWEPAVMPYSPASIEMFVAIFAFSVVGLVYTIAERNGFVKIEHH